MNTKRDEDIAHELGCYSVEVDARAREVAGDVLSGEELHIIIFVASAPTDWEGDVLRFLSRPNRFSPHQSILERFLAIYWRHPECTLKVMAAVRARQSSMTLIQHALLTDKIRTGRGPLSGEEPASAGAIADTIMPSVDGDAVKKERQRMRKRSTAAYAKLCTDAEKRMRGQK